MLFIDTIILTFMLAGLWSLLVIPLKIHVIWSYWIKLVLPMSFFLSLGGVYFGILEWIGKLISN